nr:hypothetical protein CFP56_22234 [Quercus suber]
MCASQSHAQVSPPHNQKANALPASISPGRNTALYQFKNPSRSPPGQRSLPFGNSTIIALQESGERRSGRKGGKGEEEKSSQILLSSPRSIGSKRMAFRLGIRQFHLLVRWQWQVHGTTLVECEQSSSMVGKARQVTWTPVRSPLDRRYCTLPPVIGGTVRTLPSRWRRRGSHVFTCWSFHAFWVYFPACSSVDRARREWAGGWVRDLGTRDEGRERGRAVGIGDAAGPDGRWSMGGHLGVKWEKVYVDPEAFSVAGGPPRRSRDAVLGLGGKGTRRWSRAARHGFGRFRVDRRCVDLGGPGTVREGFQSSGAMGLAAKGEGECDWNGGVREMGEMLKGTGRGERAERTGASSTGDPDFGAMPKCGTGERACVGGSMAGVALGMRAHAVAVWAQRGLVPKRRRRVRRARRLPSRSSPHPGLQLSARESPGDSSAWPGHASLDSICSSRNFVRRQRGDGPGGQAWPLVLAPCGPPASGRGAQNTAQHASSVKQAHPRAASSSGCSRESSRRRRCLIGPPRRDQSSASRPAGRPPCSRASDAGQTGV